MRLARLFSDRAVLQREVPIPVWGWATPNRFVEVRLGDDVGQAFSDAEGRFFLRLPPRPAGGPYTLTATEYEPGGETPRVSVVARDVDVGEVWLASGQSNMEWPLAATDFDADAENPPAAVRMFNVPHDAGPGHAVDADAAWVAVDRNAAGACSAVAYHFAAALHAELGVAVGVLHSSWGGTVVEAWTSRSTLMRNPAMRARVEAYDARVAAPAFWRTRRAVGNVGALAAARERYRLFCRPDPENAGFADGWAAPGHDDADWPRMKLPAGWSTRGHPETSGVFWFRREVDLPPEAAGRDAALHLGGVDKHDITYWNGEEIGRTGEGFDDTLWNRPRVYAVPGRLVRAGRNVVACRAYSFAFDGGLVGPEPEMRVRPAEGAELPLAGDWRYRIECDFGSTRLSAATRADEGPDNPNTPHILFDRMIRPLVPYALRGAIWYQGESNASAYHLYRRQMADLLDDWRFHWGQGDFPLVQVQLAGFRAASEYDYAGTESWPYLREAQLRATAMPGLGLVSALDVGEADDIHPRDKRTVGLRLAGWALANVHRAPGAAAHGPHYAGMRVERDGIRVFFTGAEGGLCTRDGEAPRTLVIADATGHFRPAEGRIEGETLLVLNGGVATPAMVRYAWADNPARANLANRAGLPASSFRTDALPGPAATS